MPPTHEPGTPDRGVSRRQLLSTISGTLALGLSRVVSSDHHETASTLGAPTPMTQQSSSSSVRQSQRPAYVALPGASTASLLANLPYLLTVSSGPLPVILLDIHDYDRLQSIALTEPDSPWNLQFTLAYQQLYRLGVVRFLDYAKFYPTATQQEVLRRNNALLADVPRAVHRRAAVGAAEGRIDYQRGSYQESFRSGIGQDLQVFTDGRRTEQSRRDDLERDRHDPVAWNEQILNQYLAALHVRRYADETLQLDVQGVIGEGETHIFGGSTDAHADRSSILPDHGAHTTTVDTSYITRLDPTQHLLELPLSGLASTRTLFDTIGEIAVDVAGVQHDDWLFFAPTIAVPRYHELFDIERIRAELRYEISRETLVEETDHVIDALRTQSESNGPNGKLQYETEWLAEHAPIAAEQTQRDARTALTEYAVRQSQYSRELRELVEGDEVSHAAALVGSCVMSGPSTRDADRTTINHRRNQMLAGLTPRSVDEKQLIAIRRRKAAWEDQSDWYEASHRAR